MQLHKYQKCTWMYCLGCNANVVYMRIEHTGVLTKPCVGEKWHAVVFACVGSKIVNGLQQQKEMVWKLSTAEWMKVASI